MNMQEFVKWLCAADETGREITAAQARKVWKRMSLELFENGAQQFGMDSAHGVKKVSKDSDLILWRDWIAHPMLINMYKNGKRLNRGKRVRRK